MKTLDDLKVGDPVYYTDVNHRDRETKQLVIHTATVTKIGSKLIYVGKGGLVFRKDTMRTNDDYCHHTLYLDVDEYIKEREKAILVQRIRNFSPTGVSYEDVVQAAKLLGLH